MSAIQVVKVSESIIHYFFEEMGMQNECQEYRDIKIKEFKEELTEALNTGVAKKEIEWIKS